MTKPTVTNIKDLYDLTSKNVIVTGGGGFLGLHFASAVAEAGAKVTLVDINADGLTKNVSILTKLGFNIDSFQLNMMDSNQVIEVISTIANKDKRIDILINSGAFAMSSLKEERGDFFAGFEDYERELWQVSLDVNLTGTFLVTQAVGRVMKRQKRGVVINVASDVGIISPDHRIYQPNEKYGYKGVNFNTPLSYSVSKAGILAMTRFLATYWAKEGIRVNSLSPAGVKRNQDEKFVEQLAERIPLGRMALPHELKGPIVFLASEASSFMTGGNLIIDGGRTIW